MSSRFHQKPLFALDWDDVVLNTDRIRDIVYSLPLLTGVTDAENRAAVRTLQGNGGYNFTQHMRVLARRHPYVVPAIPALYRAFEEALIRDTQLIYEDAERFIRRLHGEYDLAIITTGDPEFQQDKIWRSGFGHLFSHMIFVPETQVETPVAKARHISGLLEMYPRIFYFDDRIDTISQMHKEHGHHGRIVPIRVDRKLESSLKYPNIIRHFDEFDLDKWVGSGS